MKYTAKHVPPKTNYCVGVLRNGKTKTQSNKKQRLTAALSYLCYPFAPFFWLGALHLTPLHAISRLKPSFEYIDLAVAELAEEAEVKRIEHAEERKREGLTNGDDEDETESDEEKKEEFKPLMMKVKRKENEKAAAFKKQTFSYLKSMEEKEEWINMVVHDKDVSYVQLF